jgi:hypothetical protein
VSAADARHTPEFPRPALSEADTPPPADDGAPNPGSPPDTTDDPDAELRVLLRVVNALRATDAAAPPLDVAGDDAAMEAVAQPAVALTATVGTGERPGTAEAAPSGVGTATVEAGDDAGVAGVTAPAAAVPGDTAKGGPAGGGRVWREWGSSELRRWWGRAWPWVVAGGVGIASLVLRLRSPAWLVLAPNDDGIFARSAGHLVDGDWLGPYDKLTLIKGPGYPIFIAGVHDLGLPLKFAEHVLHLLACAVMGLAVGRVLRSRGMGVATFAVLALNPAYLGATAARLGRDSFYGSMCLLVVGGVLLLVSYVPWLADRGPRWAVPVLIAAGPALGFAAAGYYLTREERVWLAPAVGIVALGGVLSWPGGRRLMLRNAAVGGGAAVLAFATFAASLGWVRGENERHYGTSVIADLADGEIARAYGEWQRVRAGRERRYVPVSERQREAVYDISPTAAEMEEGFSGAATAWIGLSCAFARVCNDYMGAFFVWAMRDAAEAAGYDDSGGQVQRYFGRVADDIAEACDSGELRCSPRPLGPLPPFDRIDGGDVWDSTVDVAAVFLAYDVGEPERLTRSGAPARSWRTIAHPLRGVDDQSDYVAAEARALRHQEGVSFLTDLYRWGARIGVYVAVAGLVAGLVTRAGRRRPAALVLATAMLVATLTRVVMLAVIDATSWPGGQHNYVLPGTDYLVLFVLFGGWLLVTSVLGSIRKERDGEPGVAPEVDGPGDGTRPEPGPDRVERVVEGIPVLAHQRQR